MKVELNIGYDQLIDIINQLPPEDINRLKEELGRALRKGSLSASDDWKELILNGPIMSDRQYQAFKKNRKHFNQWRES